MTVWERIGQGGATILAAGAIAFGGYSLHSCGYDTGQKDRAAEATIDLKKQKEDLAKEGRLIPEDFCFRVKKDRKGNPVDDTLNLSCDCARDFGGLEVSLDTKDEKQPKLDVTWDNNGYEIKRGVRPYCGILTPDPCTGKSCDPKPVQTPVSGPCSKGNRNCIPAQHSNTNPYM
ncbi:MAG: hypothetical protein ACE5DM_00560 [Candidatus Nanoarchaeia archaeon]